MKAGKWVVMVALVLGFGNVLHAAPVGGALVYISPSNYTLLTTVGVDAYQYSFTQGQIVEPVAIAALSPLFADTLMCQSGNESDTVIWIKPSISYDPIVTLYYGEIEADVFTGSGRAIATYKSKIDRNGTTDIYPEKQIISIYQAAMQKIVQQIQADPAIQVLIKNGLPISEPMVPCNMVIIMNEAGE